MDDRRALREAVPGPLANKGLHGVVVTQVKPGSFADESGLAAGMVITEINRQPVESAAEYKRIAKAARPGDILALYVYVPDLEQRKLLTMRVRPSMVTCQPG